MREFEEIGDLVRCARYIAQTEQKRRNVHAYLAQKGKWKFSEERYKLS
jgi:hypothetical protein